MEKLNKIAIIKNLHMMAKEGYSGNGLHGACDKMKVYSQQFFGGVLHFRVVRVKKGYGRFNEKMLHLRFLHLHENGSGGSGEWFKTGPGSDYHGIPIHEVALNNMAHIYGVDGDVVFAGQMDYRDRLSCQSTKSGKGTIYTFSAPFGGQTIQEVNEIVPWYGPLLNLLKYGLTVGKIREREEGDINIRRFDRHLQYLPYCELTNCKFVEVTNVGMIESIIKNDVQVINANKFEEMRMGEWLLQEGNEHLQERIMNMAVLCSGDNPTIRQAGNNGIYKQGGAFKEMYYDTEIVLALIPQFGQHLTNEQFRLISPDDLGTVIDSVLKEKTPRQFFQSKMTILLWGNAAFRNEEPLKQLKYCDLAIGESVNWRRGKEAIFAIEELKRLLQVEELPEQIAINNDLKTAIFDKAKAENAIEKDVQRKDLEMDELLLLHYVLGM